MRWLALGRYIVGMGLDGSLNMTRYLKIAAGLVSDLLPGSLAYFRSVPSAESGVSIIFHSVRQCKLNLYLDCITDKPVLLTLGQLGNTPSPSLYAQVPRAFQTRQIINNRPNPLSTGS